MDSVYLDHAATTPVEQDVINAMLPFLKEFYGNPSTIYKAGRKAKNAIEESREIIAQTINCAPSEIIFTSGGSEANNLAIKGYSLANSYKGKHIITSLIEHPSVLNSCKYLEKTGYEITWLKVNENGELNLKELENSIKKNTILISLMHVNNEIGNINDIDKISKIAQKNKIAFHCDAVQSIGKLKIDIKDIGVNLMSFSGHKIYGPKGIGALFVKRGTRLQQLINGGHQERDMRAGTENVPGIIGLCEAFKLSKLNLKKSREYLSKIQNHFEKRILAEIPGVSINGSKDSRLYSHTNISFSGVEGEALLRGLDMKGIAVASGSACSSGSLEPSHVLSAMSESHETAHTSIRFSFGKNNTKQEIDYAIKILKKLLSDLRDIVNTF